MIIRDISRFTMYIDETFNRLTILNVYYNGPNVRAICKCSCGNIVSKRLYDVTHGIIKSCGCLNSEVRRATTITRSVTHNLSKSPLYPIWCTMHARCYNKNNEHFHRYGARGIYICDEWRRRKNSKKNGNPSFVNFYNWAMKNGYKPGLSIDRIDNDGPYAPWNCRWVTMADQGRHTSRCRYVNDGSEILTLQEFLRKYHLPKHYISNCIARGWSYHAAVYSVIRQDIGIHMHKGQYVDKDGFPVLIPTNYYKGELQCID